jgi:outer membrane lipoprotein-sorting protein
MTTNSKQLSLSEKTTLTISTLGFLVAFISFVLSDSISDLSKSVEIVSIKESTNLNTLTGDNGYIDTLVLKNTGNKTSKNIKLIVTFSHDVPKYEVLSDEDVLKQELDKQKLQISLDRLANNSKLKLVMFSENKLNYQVHYIDDNGKNEVAKYTSYKKRSYLDVISMFVVVISMGVIVCVFRRASKNNLEETLESHQRDFQEKLREIKDEIGNIEITVTPTNGMSTDTGTSYEKGITQRLVDLMKI